MIQANKHAKVMKSISKEAKIVVNDFLYGKRGNGFASQYEWNFISKYVLITSLYALQPNANKEILDILQEYNKNLADLGLEKDDIKILQNEYAAVIEYCCHFFENNGGTVSSEFLFTEPISLTEFIVELLKDNKDIENKRIYLPFAGLANIATLLPNNEFVGSEISAKAWAFANIRLSAHKLQSDIKLGNSFSEIESDSQKYDYIVMTPPWGYEDAQVATAIKKMVENNLQENGELYAVLPKTFCVGRQWQELRSYLINNKYAEAIVSLPAIFSPITEMDACLVIVDKTELQQIAFIDASSHFFVANNDYQKGGFSNVLKYRSIMDVIYSNDENYMIVEPYNMIGDNDILLPVHQLVKYKLDGKTEDYWNLNELVDLVEIKHCKPDVLTETIGISEFSTHYNDCNFVPELAKFKKWNKEYYSINQDCILLAYNGVQSRFLIVTEIESLGGVLNLSNSGVIAFKIKPDAPIIEEYLLWALSKDELVVDQMNALMNVKDRALNPAVFLQIKIRKEELSKQEDYLNKKVSDNLFELRRMLNNIEEHRKKITEKVVKVSRNYLVLMGQLNNDKKDILLDAPIAENSATTVRSLIEETSELINQLKTQTQDFANDFNIK